MSAEVDGAGGYKAYSLDDAEKKMLAGILEKYKADRSRIENEEKEIGKRLESLRISLRTLEGKIFDLQGLINEDQKQPPSGFDIGYLETDSNSHVDKSDTPAGTVSYAPVRDRGGSLSDTVYSVLKGREELSLGMRARHFRDLVGDVEALGVSVSGKDQGLNLVAHIHKDSRFTRPRPGYYGLVEWYPKNMKKSGERKRGRRRS